MNDHTPTNPPEIVTSDDDEKLFAEFSLSSENQILLLGLLVAVIMLFGSAIWSFLF